MNWPLVLLLFAGLASGYSQLLNKKLTFSNHSSKTYTAVIMLINSVFSLPLLFYQFYISTSAYIWVVIIISIIVFAFGTYFGYQAYKHAELSEVSILERLSLIFTALIGIVVLKESYTLQSAIGLTLIFIGGVLLVFENYKFKLSIGVIYALLMAVCGAIATVLDKIILEDFSPYTYVFVNNLLVGLVFVSKKRVDESRLLIKNHFRLLSVISILTNLSFLIVMVVLKDTNVSQTMPVYKGLSMLTPVILGILFLGERKRLLQKLSATVLGIIGIWLLY